ncbi:MAG: hypothetical protein DMG22_00375 [Acidobacteria bacterium]|nr:MAG: hypothetical protein DMG22_00375 [Acidobacteriota bacterium]
MVVGLAKPVHFLQRGASVDEIVNMAALAVAHAQGIAKSREAPSAE